MKTYTEAYLSGGICGATWWPTGSICGKPLRVNLQPKFKRFSDPASFRDVLESVLMEEGGDFQAAKFTADTEIVLLRKTSLGAYKYQVRARVRELCAKAEFTDLVNPDAYTSDFMGDEE